MARSSLSAWSGLLTAIFLAGSASAQQPAVPFDAPAPRVARGAAGQPLARGTAGDLADGVRGYLANAGHSEATITSLVLAGRNTVARTGVTHLRFTQRVGGLDVYGTYVKASVNAEGSLTSLIENLAAVRPVATASLAGGDGRALAISLQHVHGGAPAAPGLVRQQGHTSVFARTPFFHREPTVTRVAVPVGANGLRLGYLVETWTERGNQLHHTLVGSDGAVLGVEARTAQDKYSVFEKDPVKSSQQIVDGPAAAPAAPSPQGWLLSGAQRTTSIQGNNVHAYLDVNADNAVDAGGTSVSDGAFTAAWTGTAQPATQANRDVATQNLFFLNNVTHDRLYAHGFDEAAGNFQESNFGKGGLGSDAVLAEVQDGSGTDNANFATPADGSNPRMQMFIWLGLGNAEVTVGSTEYVAQAASFGPAPSATAAPAPLVLVNDGGGASTSDACERFPRGALNGKIAIADRGNCDFTVKVTNAQRAGAVAVIVANNVVGEIFTMSGSGSTTIPAVMVTQTDGVVLKRAAGTLGAVRAASPAPLNRDSSLDSDIVYHEYGHGLTWRMIGSMSGSMSGAIGEGMSDVLALLFNDAVIDGVEDDVIGEYASFDPNGIRSQRYATYGRTYGAFSGSGVHFDGEIYAAIGWRLRANFGLEQGALLDYIVDGMNYTPPGPAFEDMRDGILQAVQAAGAPDGHECRVWRAFAEGGVGVGADAMVRRNRVTVTESMVLPTQCQ